MRKAEGVKKRKRIIWLPLCMVAAAMLYWLWPRPLTVTHYEVEAQVTEPLRIVQLSDLHGRKFGKDNEKLISMVREQQPDLIFLTGDMFSRNDTDHSAVLRLISDLREISPVYYSYGNHEEDWLKSHRADLKAELTQAGATVLDLEYEDLAVKGQALRIGGYSGYYRTPAMETSDPELQNRKLAFADDFENTERQKLLLCHIPTSWTDWERINKHEVGIVFCGHYHGGQVRFPLIDRGLYAPYVKWFPKYTRGVFYGKSAVCVLSAGLGCGRNLPRIYNPPEIVTVDLIPNRS